MKTVTQFVLSLVSLKTLLLITIYVEIRSIEELFPIHYHLSTNVLLGFTHRLIALRFSASDGLEEQRQWSADAYQRDRWSLVSVNVECPSIDSYFQHR